MGMGVYFRAFVSRKNYSGSPTNYQKEISNNSLPTSILWVLSLFFCYQLSGLKPTYIIIFRQFSLQPKQIKIYYNITSKKKRTEYCLYTYTKLSFLGFWPDSKPIIVTLLHTYTIFPATPLRLNSNLKHT